MAENDERLWSGYTCEVCGWFELRPQTRDRGRVYCPHCERLGRGKGFTMKQINVVPADRLEAAQATVSELQQALAMSASIIRSGESMSKQADDTIHAALTSARELAS